MTTTTTTVAIPEINQTVSLSVTRTANLIVIEDLIDDTIERIKYPYSTPYQAIKDFMAKNKQRYITDHIKGETENIIEFLDTMGSIQNDYKDQHEFLDTLFYQLQQKQIDTTEYKKIILEQAEETLGVPIDY